MAFSYYYLIYLAFSSSLMVANICSSNSIFILIGGTGELSSKYLWDSVFRQAYLPYHQNNNQKNDDPYPLNDQNEINSSTTTNQMKIYTSGRSDDAEGKAKLTKILNSLHCSPESGEKSSCPKNVKKFASSIEYVKLENDIDYGKFCAELFTVKRPFKNIKQVLWYLAIPPSYYPIVLMSLHTRCRNDSSSMKIAMEQPFFKDDQDYVALNRILAGRFKRNELFMVDNYLAQETALAVKEFRRLNKHWYNTRFLEQVELVLLEREFVSDKRMKFHEEYGIVKDSMMGHLNEIMLLLLKDLGGNDEDENDDASWDEDDEMDSVRELLQRIRPFARSQWVFGQHKHYSNLTRYQSKTPTFASLRFKLDVAPRSGDTVEKNVILVSGKYMDAKRSYARLLFRNSKNKADFSSTGGSPAAEEQYFEVIFLFSAPLILVKRLPDDKDKSAKNQIFLPRDWISDKKKDEEACQKWISRIFTETPCSQFQAIKFDPSFASSEIFVTPYDRLIRQFILAPFGDPQQKKKHNDYYYSSIFTNTLNVEESWKILWSHVIKDVDAVEKKEIVKYENAGEILSYVFPDKNRIIVPKLEL